MNSMERILATLAGKSVDRNAFTMVLSLYGARLTNCPLKEYYTNPVAYALGQNAVRETFQPDVLFSPFDFASLGAAFGSELHWFGKEAPNLSKPAVASVKEWDKLKIPDSNTNPQLQYFRESIKLLVADNKGEVPIAALLPAPTDIPEMVMGLENWLDTILFDPDGAERIMSIIIPFFVRIANEYFDAGASFLALPTGFASPAIVTSGIVQNFARPILEKAFSQLKGPVVLHHAGAPWLAHLKYLTGLPNVVAIVVDQKDNIAESRKILGPDMVIFSGPIAPRFKDVNCAQLEAEFNSLLKNRSMDHRFILSNSGPDIPWDTPKENILSMRRVVENFAK